MEKNYFKKLTSISLILVLLVLSFLLLKPFLLVVILALILAFIFYSPYLKLAKFLRSKNLSAFLICILLALLIILPIWFLTPIVLNQSFHLFLSSQQIDFVTPLKKIFPSLFASEEFSAEVGSVIYSFKTRTTNYLMNSLSKIICGFVNMFLQLIVVFFTFFFVLPDISYLYFVLCNKYCYYCFANFGILGRNYKGNPRVITFKVENPAKVVDGLRTKMLFNLIDYQHPRINSNIRSKNNPSMLSRCQFFHWFIQQMLDLHLIADFNQSLFFIIAGTGKIIKYFKDIFFNCPPWYFIYLFHICNLVI